VLTALVGAVAIGLSLGLLGSGGSLLVVGLIAAAAVVPHARGRQIAWLDVLWFGLPGMAGGSVAGHRIGRRLPQSLLRRVFGVVLLLLGGAIAIDAARQLLP
jgi:uncharacterized protein